MGYTDTLVGSVLGDYQLERLLGQSQLGAAYLALQLSQNRRVMITIFPIPEGMSTQEYERFQMCVVQEGKILTQLSHPHILPVYACGALPGHTYLVTAFVKEASLGQLLKENLRFSPQQVLPILKQLTAALDYAHGRGIVHGMLGLSNVIVSDDLNVQIAGFGLRSLLEIYGGNANGQPARPLEHLTSKQGAFLGNPESIAPERVLGMAIDARADVYALGVMLFALLSGTQPFKGSQPLEMALQRLQQPVPSLHTTCLDVPEAFDLVIEKMLERDPAKRTPYAGDAALAFERVVKTGNISQTPGVGASNAWMQQTQITIPPTVNWFDEEIIPADSWQAGSPGATHVFSPEGYVAGTDQTPSFPSTGALPQANNHAASLGGTDPFLWWSSASTGGAAGTFSSRPPQKSNASKGRLNSRRTQQDRRRLVKLITVGSVAAGVVTIGGISLAKLAQSQKNSLSQLANTSQHGSTTNNGASAPGSTPGATNTPSPSKSPTAQPTSSKGAQPSPTAKPTQSAPTPPPPPSHTGTVIGHTSQATNSAIAFTNPADGQASWLVHMGNGNFVACEQACTHAGVPVKYNASSGKFVCPAHGAMFNADGSNPTSPAPRPLPPVHVVANSDGTVTTG